MSETGTALEQRSARPIDSVRQALERMRPQLAMALPKHLTTDRLLRVAMTAVQNTPKLLECDRGSLYSAVFACAQLGLEPDGVLGQAYLVPFNGRVQFIPGYKGLLALARNSGEVSSIAAHEVCDNDTFEFDFASGDPPRHTFDLRRPRGEVIAFYAVVKFKDGGSHWDMMTRAEVDAIRDQSQGWKAAVRTRKQHESPWGAHYNEMAKKTIIRRIVKYLPLSVQKAAALADGYDAGRHVSLDRHGELVVEPEERAPAPMLEAPSQLERFEERHSEPGPSYDPETGEVFDDKRADPLWLAEMAALHPKEDAAGKVDWKTYAEAVVYLISKAGPRDLDTVEVTRNAHLRHLREADIDLFRNVTEALNERARELVGTQATGGSP